MSGGYWRDCVEEAMEDAKLVATKEQIDTVTSWVEGAAENESTGRGHDCIPDPALAERERMKRLHDRELSDEREAAEKNRKEWDWQRKQLRRQISDLRDELNAVAQ